MSVKLKPDRHQHTRIELESQTLATVPSPVTCWGSAGVDPINQPRSSQHEHHHDNSDSVADSTGDDTEVDTDEDGGEDDSDEITLA